MANTAVLLAVSAVLPSTAAAQAGKGFSVTFDKAFSPSSIGPGSVTTLQFDIVNPFSSPIENVAFTDALPAAITIATPANASSTCGGTLSASDGGGTISLAGGAIGGPSSCVITVNVTSNTAGTHVNTSGGLTWGSESGVDGPTDELTVSADRPGFSKSFSPNTVFLGARSTLTFTIDNSASTVDIRNLNFTDALPAGLVIASPTNKATDCPGGAASVSAPPGQGTIAYNSFTAVPPFLDMGATCTVSVDVVGAAAGVINNVSSELTFLTGLSGTLQSGGSASAVLNVTTSVISLEKSFTDDPVAPGGTVDLEFTIRNLAGDSDLNNGRADLDATNIAFSDDLEAALSGLARVDTQTVACGGSLSGTSVLNLSGASVPSGETCTFSVTLDVPSGAATGAFTNTTSTIVGDIDGEQVNGNAATDVLFVSPTPLLTKEFIDDPVGAGGMVELEFTITNTSSTSSAMDITFADVFDTVIQTASSVPADDFCGAGSTATFTPLINPPPPSDAIPATLVVSGANLAASGSCTFSVVLDVLPGAASGFYTNTTSEISATVDGAPVRGKPASDDLEVRGAPSLTKEFTDDPAQPGDTATLEFTLTHDETAPAQALDITFTDNLELTLSGLVATAGLLPATDVCGAGSEIDGTSTLELTGGSLGVGESCTFSVSLDVPVGAAPGAHTNVTSMVEATVLGATAMNNPAEADLQIAGLTHTKEFIDGPVLPGGQVTLRFAINNISPTEGATAIRFTDNLDDALDGLSAVLPLPDTSACGVGSSLIATSGNRLLTFLNGELGATESCSFDVTLDVPAEAVPDTYVNGTSGFSATIGGSTVGFDFARDELIVADPDADQLTIEKKFSTLAPVDPGGDVDLSFTIFNLSTTDSISDIAFTDDLDAALSGLVATGLPAAACGGTVSGTDTISLTGAAVASDDFCTFVVSLAIPGTAESGSVVTNTTSEVTGTLAGQPVTGGPATDDLVIEFPAGFDMEFSKDFLDNVDIGSTVDLQFTIENRSPRSVDNLSFSDNLDAVVAGLVATGLPVNDVCGTGSVLDGTDELTLTGGSLNGMGSCTFSVSLQVPVTATPGSYLNTTDDLLVGALVANDPASDFLVVNDFIDLDGDSVDDRVDECPDTVIPEAVPTQGLNNNHHALMSGDPFIFDTMKKNEFIEDGSEYTIQSTVGCSCEQIIEAQGLGQGHTKNGCSNGAMAGWVEQVGGGSLTAAPSAVGSRSGRARSGR